MPRCAPLLPLIQACSLFPSTISSARFIVYEHYLSCPFLGLQFPHLVYVPAYNGLAFAWYTMTREVAVKYSFDVTLANFFPSTSPRCSLIHFCVGLEVDLVWLCERASELNFAVFSRATTGTLDELKRFQKCFSFRRLNCSRFSFNLNLRSLIIR